MNRTAHYTPADAMHPVARVVAMLVFLILGSACIYAGHDVMSKRHHEVKWRISSITGSSRGIDVYEGTDATRFGIGLAALGSMGALYVIGLGAGFFRHRPQSRTFSPFARIIAGLALACLLLSILCFTPPWRSSSVPFYAVVLLVFAVAALSGSHRWTRFFFPCFVASIIVVGILQPHVATAMLLGFFAAIVILIHMIALSPKWSARLR